MEETHRVAVRKECVMGSILIPIIVILVAVFAVALWMDVRRRRSPNLPSSGDERARRKHVEADQRSGHQR